MRKKRILFCSEATFLNTGYATYTREILKYLHGTGKYEIAEMGCYGKVADPQAADIPWKFYGVVPPDDWPEEKKQEYHAKPTNQFGEWIFEDVCLDFLPDIVCDIRDFWMLDFAERSPFRDYFKYIWQSLYLKLLIYSYISRIVFIHIHHSCERNWKISWVFRIFY